MEVTWSFVAGSRVAYVFEPTAFAYQFTVEVRDECHDIIVHQDAGGTKVGAIAITKNSDGSSATESSPFQFDMWEQQIMDIKKIEFANRNTPTVALAHTKCVVDYEITDINAERSEIFGATPGFVLGNDYYITPDDGSGVD